MPAAKSPEPSIYMDLEQVLHATTLSMAVWYGLVKVGDAPKPRQISANRSAWLRREIMDWCEARPVSQILPPVNSGKGATRAARAARAMAGQGSEAHA